MAVGISTYTTQAHTRGRNAVAGLWAGVVITGRTIAYDWFDCHKQLPYAMYWAAGCVDEMAALQ